MNKRTRIILFIISLSSLLFIYWLSTGNWVPVTGVDTVIFSALIMLSFVTLFLEHFFTRPTDVLASTIGILLVLSPLRNELTDLGIWYWLFYVYNMLLLISSLLSLLLVDDSKAKNTYQNKAAELLKSFSTYFGNGRFLFFCLFFLTLLFYVDSQTQEFLLLFMYSAVIVLIDPKRFILSIFEKNKGLGEDVGKIIGVQSRNMFLAKLYKQRVPVRRFDFVQFRYSMEEGDRISKGLIVDNYLLDEQQWIKILRSPEIENALIDVQHPGKISSNIVYKISPDEGADLLKRLVGTVVENSKIEMIRFEYGSKVSVAEGNLLEASISGKKVLYQIVQGHTKIEMLESKNEAGLIVGEAMQLGVWNDERRAFDRFGWLPGVNTPVFLASDIQAPEPAGGEEKIGNVPNTNYPVLMNIHKAVAHHIAVLGVTGSGKSVFTRNLIRKVAKSGTKVICVDFTNEYGTKLNDISPQPIVSDVVNNGNSSEAQKIFDAIDKISFESDKFPNQQKKEVFEENEKIIKDIFSGAIQRFLKDETQSLMLFELPDVSNTTGILEYTRWFFKVLFEIAKNEKNFGQNLCVVLEEAHTVIPEWNFIGTGDKRAGAVINSIGQIALQGRKYNVGFIIVAQRTANVSKTVLTQCNSIIAFQQFDNTSREFLGNYMGNDMVDALPNLRFRQAVAVGKGFQTGIPIIFEVPEITEPSSQDNHTPVMLEEEDDEKLF